MAKFIEMWFDRLADASWAAIIFVAMTMWLVGYIGNKIDNIKERKKWR